MPDNDKRASLPPDGSVNTEARLTISARLEHFERRQGELWRLTFFVLLLLAIVFAWMSWDSLSAMAGKKALPIGLITLIVLFVAYIWKRTQEISELRGIVRGIEQRDSAPPSEKQLDQLFEVIARSQQGYRDLIDSFDDVLVALTTEGEIRSVNRSFADLVGVPFQQIIGKPLSEFVQQVDGDGPEMARRGFPRFLERRTWTGVVQVRFKNQSHIYYFDCTAHAMTRADKVHGITVLARDITALRKNEARFTELFETLQEGIYVATPSGAVLDVNPALVRMLGYDSKAELLARSVPELITDRSERKALKDEVEKAPTPQGREITLTRKDGSTIVCLNTATAVRSPSGDVVRYQGSVMDITERRAMERRLHQQQEFARRLVDSFPDLILVVNAAGAYTFVSPRVREVLGYEIEETHEMVLGGRTHPDDRVALDSVYRDVLDGKKVFASLELRVRHKDGEWRRLLCHFSPLSDERGQIEGVVMSCRDVTELKRLEEQLIQAEKLAAMGQMLAGVAHELNNPLTAILGVTELLREREGFDDPAKRQLELTHRQARRAARIVQNLLEFARPASPQKKPLDVNSLVERTLQLHEHSLRRNNVVVDFTPQPDLPGVIGDGNQLIQIFLNLITNAEQAIREVRETGRIQIRLSQYAGKILLTVQDDGVGIRPEALPRLFDPFYTTKRPGGGTGLGLSICLSIIKEHGGTIEAEALPAGGSAFTVYLPVATSGPVPPMVDSGTVSLDPDPSIGEAFKDRAILVLDDEESIRMLLEEGLSTHGFSVDTAATPDQALALARRRSYDVLLCDLNLSTGGAVVNGAGAADLVLAASGPRKPVVVFMTGELLESTNGNGAVTARRLQKPFRISDVLAVLREIAWSEPTV
ncbi:MAG: PAS domain S-box protein [Candidatus Acidiferrum sp.]|jgi:PAS domain S-box-containing protein